MTLNNRMTLPLLDFYCILQLLTDPHLVQWRIYRSNHQRYALKNGARRNFTKVTKKQLRQASRMQLY